MKLSIFILLMITIACTANLKNAAAPVYDNIEQEKDSIIQPYKPYYSSSFEMGNPEHASIILSIRKDWDNNTLDNSLPYLSETIRLHFQDGTRLNGPKKEVWEEVKKMRSLYGKVQTDMGAWFPFKSTDKKGNWVGIWATEYRTDRNGIRDSIDLHQIWSFDKNNKVKFLSQYDALFDLKQKGRPR